MWRGHGRNGVVDIRKYVETGRQGDQSELKTDGDKEGGGCVKKIVV